MSLCNYVQVREQIERLLVEGHLASEFFFRHGKSSSVLRLGEAGAEVSNAC